MFMDSGTCEKKSMMRQPSWMWFLGFGLSAWTMSGNLMPSLQADVMLIRHETQTI